MDKEADAEAHDRAAERRSRMQIRVIGLTDDHDAIVTRVFRGPSPGEKMTMIGPMFASSGSSTVAMQTNSDFEEILLAFNAARVKYLVVGAYAVGAHSRPRATGDIDLWIDVSPDNASRVYRALAEFGAPMEHIDEQTFCEPDMSSNRSSAAADRYPDRDRWPFFRRSLAESCRVDDRKGAYARSRTSRLGP